MRYFSSANRLYRVFSFLPNIQPFRKMSHFPKVFVKNAEAEEKLKIFFTYGVQDLPDRNFTFMRPKEEKLEMTITRMKLKMLEAIDNKMKRKKRKASPKITEENKVEFPLTISLLKEGELINTDVKNVDAWTENTQMKINECVYEVSENPPSVLHLSLPKNIMSGFPVYPKIELEFCSKEQCNFSWYRSLSKSDKAPLNLTNPKIIKIKNEYWVQLSNNFSYITSESDIGCKLRISCLPKCEEKTGIEEVAVSTTTVELGPMKCPFEDRHVFTTELTEPGRFRCVSYNILADAYADSDTARNELFPYCPAEALVLDYRKQLYLKEIIGYNADVICLQEVDRKVFYGDLIPVLTSIGLDGVYSEKGGQVIEGVSCFYRTSKFKLIESHAIILSEALTTDPIFQPILSKLAENDKLKEKFMTRTTALQVVLLESLDVPQKRLLVANTHLFFHPVSDNIRIIQAAACITYLQSLLRKYQEESLYSTSLIFSGDFNSCLKSGAYELITKGSLSPDCKGWQSNPEEIVPGLHFSHTLSLGSGCGTPKYTNYTEAFSDCLDYIFYDKSQLKICDIVPFPKHEQVIRYKALPNKVFPSDHIALICTLEWK